MFLALFPLHYRTGFPFVLPFAPKDPPSFTEKFEKSFMVLLLVPRVVAVELGMKLFSICFHFHFHLLSNCPHPHPKKASLTMFVTGTGKSVLNIFFFHDVRISKQ